MRKTSLLPGTRAMYRTSGSTPGCICVGRAGGFEARSRTEDREVASTVGVEGMSRAINSNEELLCRVVKLTDIFSARNVDRDSKSKVILADP